MDLNQPINVIEHEDMLIIRGLAEKYKMSVADFGRVIVRQAERNLSRHVRVSDDEYNYILAKAGAQDITITEWCSYACHSFLQQNKENNMFNEIRNQFAEKRKKRGRRISVSLKNRREDTELQKIAAEYSIKISALIRFCILKYEDGTTA